MFISSCRLTERETQILEYLLQGKKDFYISDKLHISQRTVRHHMTNIFYKYQVKTHVELIVKLRDFEVG